MGRSKSVERSCTRVMANPSHGPDSDQKSKSFRGFHHAHITKQTAVEREGGRPNVHPCFMEIRADGWERSISDGFHVAYPRSQEAVNDACAGSN